MRGGLAARMAAALAALALLIAALGGLAFWGARETAREIARAEASLTQLEIARAIEAAFNRYLLREIGRRLEADAATRESPEAAQLRGALLTYRRANDARIAAAGPDGAPEARQGLLRARTLAALFEAIETESMLDRRARAAEQGEVAAREFLTRIAGERDGAFRDIVSQSLAAERAEAAAAYAALDRLRRTLALWGGGLAAAFLGGATLFGLAFHRSLMRPIQGLAAAAEAFGAGDRAARAPGRMPREFAPLAARFDAMAARIAGERDRLEAEVAARTADLAAANEALRRTDAARRRFFANVSHELRTPVTVLLGEARVALRGEDAGAQREALERIAASGGYLRRRLDDLMNLARSEDGELTLTMGEADLNAVAATAVGAARAYAQANEIALELALPPEPPRLRGDAAALQQAALALIDNAVKFSPPGSTVRVSVEAAGGRARLAVADAGPGFEGDDPGRLFDRYAQAGAGRRAGGAGLGLAIVRWIAEKHGGRAVAANRPGGGAEVAVELPEAP